MKKFVISLIIIIFEALNQITNFSLSKDIKSLSIDLISVTENAL